MLKHGILGLLNYGSMTGYEINKAFKDSLSYFWNAQTSQIYRELQAIKKNGWATDEVVEQVGKPDKKVFTITKSGMTELNRWLMEDNTEFITRIPIIMKTFFMGERSIDENIEYFSRLADMGYRKAIIKSYILVFEIDEAAHVVRALRFFHETEDYAHKI